MEARVGGSPGIFITFEGIEGAGKSTQLRRLAERLGAPGVRVRVTREPGGTELGDEVRRLLGDSRFAGMGALTELFLFQAARVEHVARVIRPAMVAGEVVLCDRFTDATIAYQHFGRGLPREEVERCNRLASEGLVPSRTILLDLPPADGLARVVRRHERGEGERNRLDQEAVAFYERVREGYLALARAEPGRFRVLDGRRDEGEVARQVLVACEDLFSKRGRDD